VDRHLAQLRTTNSSAEMVLSSMLDTSQIKVTFDQVIGLKKAKAAINDALILPSKRPDLFTGIRAPPKGKEIEVKI